MLRELVVPWSMARICCPSVTPEDSFNRVCIIYTGLTIIFSKTNIGVSFCYGNELSTYNYVIF